MLDTVPGGDSRLPTPKATAPKAGATTARSGQHELLYKVVREAMLNAGVLPANYKFKVLSLDHRDRRFLVMMDLSDEVDSQTRRLAEIEAVIARHAKIMHGIAVSAVYWRVNPTMAVAPSHGAAWSSRAPAHAVAPPLVTDVPAAGAAKPVVAGFDELSPNAASARGPQLSPTQPGELS